MNHQGLRIQRAVLGTAVIRSVKDAGATVDVVALVIASWWLAVIAIAVLQQAHAGLHEHLELTPVLHLVRDAALSVPAAAIAVGLATWTTHVARRGSRSQTGRLLWLVVAVSSFAVLSVPGHALHGALFGAEEEEGVSLLADLLMDAGIALVGGLFALIPYVLVAGPPTTPGIHRSGSGSESSRPSGPGSSDDVARSAH